MDTKKIDMAYAAGILDGDGSFSIIKGSGSLNPLYYPNVQLSKHKKEMVYFLKDQFGGNVSHLSPRINPHGIVGKERYKWAIRVCAKASPMLKEVIPYLVIKKERAQFLLEFCDNFSFLRGYPLSTEKLFEREAAYLKMIHMNSHLSYSNVVSTKIARMVSADPLFWSYVAGLMDTDGSFAIKKQTQNKGTHVINPRYTPVISLSFVDVSGINFLRNGFPGGKLYLPKNKYTSNGFHYQFGVYTKIECIEFLKNIIPFLRSKKLDALQLLEFCAKSNNTKACVFGIPQDELIFREECYENLIHIHKYGVSKSPLIDLKLLAGHAEDNKAEAAQAGTVNEVSEETTF